MSSHIRQWLGWPEKSTKEKIEALKQKDDELSARLKQQFDELEDLLAKPKKSA